MPKGSHLSRAHQVAAALQPRPKRLQNSAAKARRPDETLDEATLRLQVARADTEELDRQRREIELAKARGELVTKQEAVDLAQAAVLRVCQILDLLPERVRDIGRPPTPEDLDEIIRVARQEIARGE